MAEKERIEVNKITQKEKKRIEILKRKFQLEQERMIKPGDCNKFLKVLIHDEIPKLTAGSGSKIVEKLQELGMKTAVSKDVTPHTITWKRQIHQKKINDKGEVIQFDDIEIDEPYLLMILQAKSFVDAIRENKLLNMVQAAQEVCTATPVSSTLVIYGLKSYCRKNKNVTSLKETEIKLTQIQMLANCSHRLHENPEDLALTVAQISKAIAEEPYKNKQNQKLDQEQLFLSGNDVKVAANENDPDSLSRLWHSQLTCLPKVTFDVAQSISKEYKMPRKLLEAYQKCDGDRNQMLADIPIIKTGPLSKARRIGPELSRKIATLMTSKNPNDLL